MSTGASEAVSLEGAGGIHRVAPHVRCERLDVHRELGRLTVARPFPPDRTPRLNGEHDDEARAVDGADRYAATTVSCGALDRSRGAEAAAEQDPRASLWAASGQTRLERAHVLVGPANATAAQILKNIVLPGVGTFTICDPALVSAGDVGNNFFLDASSLGKSRANEVARLLCELNPAVQGHCVPKPLAQVVDDHEDELVREGTLVIAVNASETEEIRIADRCWEKNVPFCAVQTNGFIGLVRIQVQEHTGAMAAPAYPKCARLTGS